MRVTVGKDTTNKRSGGMQAPVEWESDTGALIFSEERSTYHVFFDTMLLARVIDRDGNLTGYLYYDANSSSHIGTKEELELKFSEGVNYCTEQELMSKCSEFCVFTNGCHWKCSLPRVTFGVKLAVVSDTVAKLKYYDCFKDMFIYNVIRFLESLGFRCGLCIKTSIDCEASYMALYYYKSAVIPLYFGSLYDVLLSFPLNSAYMTVTTNDVAGICSTGTAFSEAEGECMRVSMRLLDSFRNSFGFYKPYLTGVYAVSSFDKFNRFDITKYDWLMPSMGSMKGLYGDGVCDTLFYNNFKLMYCLREFLKFADSELQNVLSDLIVQLDKSIQHEKVAITDSEQVLERLSVYFREYVNTLTFYSSPLDMM